MFRLWGSGSGMDKVASERAKPAGPKPSVPAVVGFNLENQMKRKRSESEESTFGRQERSAEERSSEQIRCGTGVAPFNQRSEKSVVRGDLHDGVALDNLGDTRADRSATVLSTLADSAALTPLQQSIEAQFSLEILLKHNELRLIDQELAKCQVALEQLRRCQIIPFPASTSQIENMAHVSNGTGPPTQGRGEVPPRYPAAWGVTDGPYTRHYAKWLIPDPAFDGGHVAQDVNDGVPAGRTVPEGRATRGSFTETSSVAGKSRSQRGTAGSKLQALSSGYPPSRDKAGPLILKRSTDGQLVKLVCLDCRRDNFSSAQGFINHCRIAHNRGFASHDAAALACGEELLTDESGGVILDGEQGSAAMSGYVHPLIRSAHLTKSTQTNHLNSAVKHLPVTDQAMQKPEAMADHQSPLAKQSLAGNQAPPVRPVAQEETEVSGTFVPSPQAPHLSALMRRKGQIGDLPDLISQARAKLDLDHDLPSEEDSDPDEEALCHKENEWHGALGVVGTRLPVRATMSPRPLDRPSSSKGLDKIVRKPSYLNGITPRSTYASPYASRPPTTEQDKVQGSDPMMIDGSTSFNLSPNTIESNQAPSLVSDDGDYEAHTESESLSSAEPDDEDGYLGIEVENEGDGSGPSAADPELANSGKAHPTRRPSALKGAASREGGDERHVTFVSPAKPGSRRRAGVGKGSK